MRGRKPQTADVREHNGNAARRPINVHAPKYEAIDPATPDELADPIGRAEWDRVVPLLAERGHATTIDRSLLIAYCLKYAQWIQLETIVAGGLMIAGGPKGRRIPNPAIPIANRAYSLFMRAAAELGITPTQRPRIVAPSQPEAADPFTEFQRTRPPRLARVK
jgi:P27 family predicted phage terminase small subunit